MSCKPKVSVIMVTYNQEKFVDEAIRSVVLQEFEFPYEIIINDDCSTDATFEKCIAWQERYPHLIKACRNERNIGIQRNYILSYSRCEGEYIAICEGDDYWCSKHKLQRQVDYLDTHRECNVCFHRVVNLYTADNSKSLSNGGQMVDTTIENLAQSNYITNLSVMYRRSVIKALPTWLSEVNPPDYILHMLHAETGYIHYINSPMGVYRQHSYGVWGGNNTERRLVMSMDTRRKLIEYFKDNKVVLQNLISSITQVALNLIIFYHTHGKYDEANRVKAEVMSYNKSWNEEDLNSQIMMRKKILERATTLSLKKCIKGCRSIISRFIPIPRIKN